VGGEGECSAAAKEQRVSNHALGGDWKEQSEMDDRKVSDELGIFEGVVANEAAELLHEQLCAELARKCEGAMLHLKEQEGCLEKGRDLVGVNGLFDGIKH